MRTASRRSSENIIPDDDVLASSSGNWKAVALPEPAKMISLPELAELPAKQEQKKRDSKAKLRQSQPKIDPTASTVAAPATAVTSLVPSADIHDARSSSPAMQQSFPAVTSLAAAREKKSKRNVVLGGVGLGLAAAAGLTVFVATRNKEKGDAAAERSAAPAANSAEMKADSERAKSPDDGVAQSKQWAAGAGSSSGAAAAGSGAVAAVPEPAPPAVESATITKDPKDAPGTGAVGGAPVTAVEPTPPHAAKPTPPRGLNKVGTPTAPAKRPTGKADDPKGGGDKADPKVNTKPDPAKPETGKGKKPTTGENGEPNLDDLLKDAGVEKKKDTAPKLEKKQLSAGDFKSGMAAVAGRAQACYNGTQGTATVRLTVAPNGKVSKATVSGSFAGTPVAACVESAVRAATFPPWDGGPQTFGYSYLLSE